MVEIAKHGYVPERKYLHPDVEQGEQVLLYHSEKLAIASGLINPPDWTAPQVVQSHRICGDCHCAIKLIALATGREIVVKEASRFQWVLGVVSTTPLAPCMGGQAILNFFLLKKFFFFELFLEIKKK